MTGLLFCFEKMASVVDIKFVDESENFDFEKSGKSSRPRRENWSMLYIAESDERKFNAPVTERTREQKNAVVRYWRNRDRFHLGPQATLTLHFDDKKVVKKSAISRLVSKTFDDA